MQEADAERDIDRRSPQEIAASLAHVIQGHTLLVGPGQYSPYAGHARICVVAVYDDEPPKILWDRFFSRAALADLCNALRHNARDVWEAEFDTMYATGWSYAWTTSPAPLHVYDRKQCIVRLDGETVHIHGAKATSLTPRREIDHIYCELSEDWYWRRVGIALHNRQCIVVAEEREPMALADPCYDGIDLMCDAAWVAQLGKTIAKGLGVPYECNDRALE